MKLTPIALAAALIAGPAAGASDDMKAVLAEMKRLADRVETLEQQNKELEKSLSTERLSEKEPEIATRLKAVEFQTLSMQKQARQIEALEGISVGASITGVGQRANRDGVAGFEAREDDSLEVLTQSGKRHPADLVILALGVRPDTALAKSAGLAIGELCRKAGLPPGVVNVVTASGSDVDHLLEHPGVAKILFTGSVETGCHVMRKASKNVTPFVLELGGKDPAVVAPDADLERAASGIVWGAFANAGQACGSIERAYVVRSVADEFIEKVVEKTRRLRQGDPLAEATDVGPMTTAEQRDFVDAQVREAVSQGARALTGGERPVAKGYWFPPTVLVNVNHGMRVMREETFGPVLPIMVVDTVDEAITLANDSEFGLTASGWTRSTKTAQKLVEELRAGTVTINDHLFSFGEPTAIWGGLGKSGIGRSHGVHGLMELVNVKHVSVDLQDSSAAPWWYPYDGAFQAFMKKAFGLLYARDARTKMADGLGLLASGRFFGYVKVSKIATKLGKVF